MTDDDSRIKRASYRAHHRGTKEMDFILGRFADAEVHALGDAEFGAFEALMVMPDQQIQSWLAGEITPPAPMHDVVARIRRFHGLKG